MFFLPSAKMAEMQPAQPNIPAKSVEGEKPLNIANKKSNEMAEITSISKKNTTSGMREIILFVFQIIRRS